MKLFYTILGRPGQEHTKSNVYFILTHLASLPYLIQTFHVTLPIIKIKYYITLECQLGGNIIAKQYQQHSSPRLLNGLDCLLNVMYIKWGVFVSRYCLPKLTQMLITAALKALCP